ncbi:hypothetical protein Tco_1122432 [Tanacetum coccineum]|uniref:Reverse transcriptase domain-containing protein n=1 Tax=Tanacetum coccineum TaxID=301880 RepID=A0ABQ5J2U5_9ASTR
MFHVSNLKKCYADEPLAVLLDGLHLDDKLHFVEEPLEIVGREVKRLKRSRIPLVKVRWNSKRGPEFTWEREDQFKKKYPHLFTKTASSSSAASEHGPSHALRPTDEENGVTRTKKYVELSAAKKFKLTVSFQEFILWERVQVLMQRYQSFDKAEREWGKMYDAFDKFTHIKGETLHKYYLIFTQLINDMNIYNMKKEQFKVNTNL